MRLRIGVEHIAIILTVFLGFVIVAIGIMTSLDANRLSSVNRELLQRNHALGLLAIIRENTTAIRSAEYAYLLQPKQSLMKTYQLARATVETSIEALRDYHLNFKEVASAIPQLGQHAAALGSRTQRTFTIKSDDKSKLIGDALTNPEADRLLATVVGVESIMSERANEAQTRLTGILASSEMRTIITAIACLFAIVLGGFAVKAQGRSQRELLDKMSRMAQYDGMTALPNRVLTVDRLRQQVMQAARSKEAFSVLAFDLDGFKKVNDTHGHAGGDDLLKQVAKRCERSLRENDTVGRMGGDEFVAILPSTNTDGAQLASSKMLAAIKEPYRLNNGSTVFVGASIGIAVYDLHGRDAATLLKHADAASYVAKGRGKGQYVVFENGMIVPDKLSAPDSSR